MGRIVTTSRLLSLLGMALLTAGCASPLGTTARDAVWVGDPLAVGDFNDPKNWSPVGVPTGKAIIATTSAKPTEDRLPPVMFSASPTALGEISVTGNKGINIRRGQSVSLGSAGLTICCLPVENTIDGELAGNILLDAHDGENGYQVGGSGTVSGNILQRGGSLSPSGFAGAALTVKGTYTQQPHSAVVATVYPDGATHLEVKGTATLSGVLGLLLDDGQTFPPKEFKVLGAGKLQGKFSDIETVPPGLKATARYDSQTNEVWVKLSR